MGSDKQQEQSDWYEYKRLVLAALEQSDRNHRELVKKVGDLEVAVAMLQTKASIWGAIAGFICSFIASIILYIFKGR